MIIQNEADFKLFFERDLNRFSGLADLKVIIIDPYYGGWKKPEIRIQAFLNFLSGVLIDPSIIWFYSKEDSLQVKNPHVTAIDLADQGIQFHDRFLFLYDGTASLYVYHLHIGGSINAININGNQDVSVIRVSVLDNEESQEIIPLLEYLEEIHLIETERVNWRC